MQVHVAEADLWTIPADAVINPANSMGLMGAGLQGQLRKHGGDVIQQAAMAAAPVAIGAAVVTTAGQLPCKHVVHTPIMEEPGMKVGAENVRRAARAALIAADRNKFKVIAIPAMGMDLDEVPADEAVRAIVEELRAHKRPFPEQVYLVDRREDVLHAFEDALRDAHLNL